jgi:hypothetical protein
MADGLSYVPLTGTSYQTPRPYDEHFQLYIPPTSPSLSTTDSDFDQESDDQNDDPSYAANKEIKVS